MRTPLAEFSEQIYVSTFEGLLGIDPSHTALYASATTFEAPEVAPTRRQLSGTSNSGLNHTGEQHRSGLNNTVDFIKVEVNFEIDEQSAAYGYKEALEVYSESDLTDVFGPNVTFYEVTVARVQRAGKEITPRQVADIVTSVIVVSLTTSVVASVTSSLGASIASSMSTSFSFSSSISSSSSATMAGSTSAGGASAGVAFPLIFGAQRFAAYRGIAANQSTMYART